MRKFIVLLLALLAACTNGPRDTNTEDGGDDGTFGDDGAACGGEEPETPEETVVLERSDVQLFRGTEMVKLLEKLESRDPDEWKFVRRHVHPAPKPPVEYKEDGSIRRRNFDWPVADLEDMDAEQKAWWSYLLWPRHIRALLHQDDWNSEPVRARLANYGRMYARLHQFQTRQPLASATRESEIWLEFAEALLAYGDDGRELLVANMVVALSSPDDDVIYRAQDILLQIGEPAIEALCAAMWTSHRQSILGWEERIDEVTGRRIREDVVVAIGNPNYNLHIVDTLQRIGPRVAGFAISELELALDENGKSVGMAWRFRRYFIDLLGRLGPAMSAQYRAEALRAIESEIDRVVVEEYDAEALKDGKRVIDKAATDDATFFFHEYIIEALGKLDAIEGMRPIIKLWKRDEFHEQAAVDALGKLTNKSVRTLEDARELAKQLKVDLKGE